MTNQSYIMISFCLYRWFWRRASEGRFLRKTWLVTKTDRLAFGLGAKFITILAEFMEVYSLCCSAVNSCVNMLV